MENNAIRTYGTYTEIENNDPSLVQEWNAIIASEDSQDKHQQRFGISILIFVLYFIYVYCIIKPLLANLKYLKKEFFQYRLLNSKKINNKFVISDLLKMYIYQLS